MRAQIAFAIYVSLATGAFAEGPVSATKKASESPVSDWKTVYRSALDASRRGSYEESLGLLQQSWDTSHTDEEHGVSAASAGRIYRRLNRTKEAQEWMERARQSFRADSRLASPLAVTTADLADLYRGVSDYPEAERLLREALLSSAYDVECKALLRNNLADLLREEGRSAEAQPLFEESIKDSIHFSPASWKLRAFALIGLADIDRQKGSWEASIDRWNQALELCRRERDSVAEAVAVRGLGTTWLKAGEAARAEPLLRRAVWITENNSDMPPEETASAHSGLGELYRSENKLALAENEWARALEIDRKTLGDGHPQVAVLMEMLSEVYSARGEFGLAREYAIQASDTMRSSFGENSMPAAAALVNRATVEERAGALDAAVKDYERALDITRVHPEYHAFQGILIQRYAGLKARHRSREAKAVLTQGETRASETQVSLFQAR